MQIYRTKYHKNIFVTGNRVKHTILALQVRFGKDKIEEDVCYFCPTKDFPGIETSMLGIMPSMSMRSTRLASPEPLRSPRRTNLDQRKVHFLHVIQPWVNRDKAHFPHMNFLHVIQHPVIPVCLPHQLILAQWMEVPWESPWEIKEERRRHLRFKPRPRWKS